MGNLCHGKTAKSKNCGLVRGAELKVETREMGLLRRVEMGVSPSLPYESDVGKGCWRPGGQWCSG